MHKRIHEIAKPSLRHISPYVPGKPIQEVQRELGLTGIIKLASNENPLGPSPMALTAIRNALNDIHRYPEGSAFYLKRRLAEHLNVPPEMLLISSGSSEAISLFLEAFTLAGDEIVMPTPSFIIYAILSHMLGAVPIPVALEKDFTYDLDAFADRITPRTKFVILCSPNNPTGTVIRRDQWESFLKRVPENVFIISDEAYFEYVESPEFGSGFPHLDRGNVIVVRTFSKIYGLAGLRIGYGIANEHVIGVIEKIRPPFNTTGIAQEAALAALDDREHVRRSAALNSVGKKFLCREFSRLGIAYTPTEANFILCRFAGSATKLVKDLEQRGIIIRLVQGFGLPDNFVRITIGTHEENEALIRALEEMGNP